MEQDIVNNVVVHDEQEEETPEAESVVVVFAQFLGFFFVLVAKFASHL